MELSDKFPKTLDKDTKKAYNKENPPIGGKMWNRRKTGMKLSENKDKRITVRLSESDHNYMKVASYMAGITISKYFRQLIDATVNAMKVQEKKGTFNLEEMLALIEEENG